ncbi:MAG: 50S ribosomal protein L11 methyltransferase [Hyphomonadaceae bacterium]|nr:50S ribosomal protein L11 methyltransferase [Hyphomonadaceae bacterium]
MLLVTAIGPLASVKAAADAFDAIDPSPADAVSWFEEGHGRFRLEVYAEDADSADAACAVVRETTPDLEPRIAALEDADWVAMSLDGLPPVRAGRFVVAGAHALGRVHGGRTRVWIEASEAFGTGHHGTTLGCLMMLEAELKRRRVRRVLDVGAGSGVLAIAAAKTGAAALAVEIDARAAAIMDENIANNRVRARVRTIAGDGARHVRSRYDLVFANILMRPLIRLAPQLARALAPGGTLILSGLLTKQEPLIRLAYGGRGLTLVRRFRREAWSTLVFRRGAISPPAR